MTVSPGGALEQILAAGGYDVSGASPVAFTGTDNLLPTPMLLGTAGAAAIGAVGVAVDTLRRTAGHKPQRIAVDLAGASAAVRSNELMRRDGKLIEDHWRGISGFKQTGDGRWVRFHCNFPHHERAVLAVLKCSKDPADVARALSEWEAPALEDAVLDGGGCAYMARTGDEWCRHPQHAALAELPLLQIERIGDGDPVPMPAGDRPLAGVRVLDLTRVIAGPVIGRTLAEHGAEVLRVASPKLPFIEPLVIDTGFGKRSAHIDLEEREGRETLARLVRGADVFVQGYRPGAIAGKGFDPRALAKLRPGIVAVDLCAWSDQGPWAHRRGFDSLVQTATGWTLELGGPTPKLQPAQAIDYVTGFLGAFGVLVALARRAVEGGSWHVRLSLAQTGHWIDNLGRSAARDARSRPTPDAATVAGYMRQAESGFGRIDYLGPVLSLERTPPFWASAPVQLGTHPPAWTGNNQFN